MEEALATQVGKLAGRFEVFDTDGRPVTPDSFPGRRALTTDVPLERVFRYQSRISGEEHWVRVRARELLGAHGEVAGAVTVVRDITARQRALVARQESEQRLAF